MAETTQQAPAEEQASLAERLVAAFPRPPQVSQIKAHLGPDYQGNASLWLEVYVRPDLLEASRLDLQELTRFTNDLQEHLLRNGVTLFAYTTLEQLA